MLSILLPTVNYKIHKDIKTFGNYQLPNYSWIDEMLTVSSWMENTPAWDVLWLRILTRTANSSKTIDWNPYIPILFSKFVFFFFFIITFQNARFFGYFQSFFYLYF